MIRRRWRLSEVVAGKPRASGDDPSEDPVQFELEL